MTVEVLGCSGGAMTQIEAVMPDLFLPRAPLCRISPSRRSSDTRGRMDRMDRLSLRANVGRNAGRRIGDDLAHLVAKVAASSGDCVGGVFEGPGALKPGASG